MLLDLHVGPYSSNESVLKVLMGLPYASGHLACAHANSNNQAPMAHNSRASVKARSLAYKRVKHVPHRPDPNRLPPPGLPPSCPDAHQPKAQRGKAHLHVVNSYVVSLFLEVLSPLCLALRSVSHSSLLTSKRKSAMADVLDIWDDDCEPQLQGVDLARLRSNVAKVMFTLSSLPASLFLLHAKYYNCWN